MTDHTLSDTLPVAQMAAEHTAVVEHTVAVESIVVVVALVVGMPVVLLLGSTEDRVLGPCRLSSRLCRSIYHSDCTRILRASWGDRNTDRVMEPEWVRLR